MMYNIRLNFVNTISLETLMGGWTKELCCDRPYDKKGNAVSRRGEEGQQ
jgi:hypothetical protein